MTDSHNAPSTKSCFSGIIRRILCTGSLPTHPSDSDPSENQELSMKIEEGKGHGTPGVVARLMGLESLPDMKWIPNDSINFRSRSIRSADFFSKFDNLSQESQHRRVKTSVSFREIPTFLHQQNEDFFVVCFDNKNAIVKSPDQVVGFQEMKKVKRSSKNSNGNSKERSVVKKKLENQENKRRNLEPKRSSNNVLPYYNKSNEVYVRSSPNLKKKKPVNNYSKEVSKKRETRRRRPRKIELEFSSIDNSSSDSFTTTTKNSRMVGLNSNPKKYSIPKVEKVECPCLNNSLKRSNADEDQETMRPIQSAQSESLVKSKKVDFDVKNYQEVYLPKEEDTNGSNNWPLISSFMRFEDCEDMCLEFEEKIFQMLVQEVVDELC